MRENARGPSGDRGAQAGAQGALYELGSALTLFQLKTCADEFRAAAEGKVHAPPIDEDATVVAVQHDVEETTRDFILKTLAQETKGHSFAHFVEHLLNAMATGRGCPRRARTAESISSPIATRSGSSRR